MSKRYDWSLEGPHWLIYDRRAGYCTGPIAQCEDGVQAEAICDALNFKEAHAHLMTLARAHAERKAREFFQPINGAEKQVSKEQSDV